MKPITYSLQFRGQASELDAGLRKQASAPGGAIVTSLTRGGVAGCFVWAPAADEAFFESTLAFADAERFDERGTIVFAPGHALRVRGRGRLVASRDPHLRHGAVIWEVVGGEGQFANASGRITSNFFLSDTGDLTENQLGVVFTGGETPSRAALGELDQGCPRRERAPRRETLDA